MSIRAKRKVSAHIRSLGVWSVGVHRTPRHIYLQLRNPEGQVVAGLSSLSKVCSLTYGGNQEAARVVGEKMGELIKKQFKLDRVAFNRSGFVYTGRIKAAAEGLRTAVEC